MIELFGQQWKDETIAHIGIDTLTHLSNETIGDFYFVGGALDHDTIREKESIKIILSLIREKSNMGFPYVICFKNQKVQLSTIRSGRITLSTIDEILYDFPITIGDRIDKILVNLYNLNSNYGASISNYNDFDFFTSDHSEMIFLFKLMNKRGLVEGQLIESYGTPVLLEEIQISDLGWQLIDQLIGSHASRSKQVFIAMWFNESTDSAYVKIDSALRSLGFIPLRIDLKEHNNEISGEILYEIHRSRFIIADVTGQRQGVYFEAGFAMGLKIPVIWTCRVDEIDKVHFDTRQYNHIVWKDEEELYNKLIARVKGTILI